ncbi:hypothetical protein EVAR_37660_1 [Eumeta japonica]|uniref:Uncharacterized protein n=1 Tax=Eumeta variegata TaxID=151549 RepID=A0A4C1YW79_EUMVA|nr:hypothetical protein EVAR_37660_1 [Eumeta japonica]
MKVGLMQWGCDCCAVRVEFRKDRCKNSDVREPCDLKEYAVNRVERVCDEKVGKGRSRKSYADHIRGILKVGQILNTRIRRACMKRLMEWVTSRRVLKSRTRGASGRFTGGHQIVINDDLPRPGVIATREFSAPSTPRARAPAVPSGRPCPPRPRSRP